MADIWYKDTVDSKKNWEYKCFHIKILLCLVPLQSYHTHSSISSWLCFHKFNWKQQKQSRNVIRETKSIDIREGKKKKKKPKTNQKEAPASNYYQCHRLVMGSFRRFIFTQWHLQWPPRHLSLVESTHIVLHQLCLSTDNLQSDHLITKRDIQHNKQFRRSTIKRYEEDW